MSYYNTTSMDGEPLKEAKSKALSQNRYIHILFKAFVSLGASQTYELYEEPKPPITSIRRSITDLTKEGILTKTPNKRMGMYGRPEYIYRLNKPS